MIKNKSADAFSAAQNLICSGLEKLDGTSTFREDAWERTAESPAQEAEIRQTGIGSGGGITRVLEGGAVFEKAGVNFSRVEGTLTPSMSKSLAGVEEELPFFATGISVVIHPRSPLIPTTHANFRYLEAGDKAWFGGGADLTPYVLSVNDAAHFHRTYKTICDRHDASYYSRFKKQCDEYFFIPHRKETRGIGGIFFDYMGREDRALLEPMFSLVAELAPGFCESYFPLVQQHAGKAWTEAQKHFQLLRRGRYVEFNLTYDRGTHFGLQTGGRIESILMSLPPEVRWEYDVRYAPNSPEAELLTVLQNPREWV